MDKRKQERLILKINTYFDIVSKISNLSVSQTLKVGSMAIKKDFSKIASFGYNGSYHGAKINPGTNGEELSLKPGKSGFIHSEVNTCIKFREHDPENYYIFLTHSPCRDCSVILINAGFKHVYWLNEYRKTCHLKIFDECGIEYGTKEDLIKKLI